MYLIKATLKNNNIPQFECDKIDENLIEFETSIEHDFENILFGKKKEQFNNGIISNEFNTKCSLKNELK